jgi:hypothetical protein
LEGEPVRLPGLQRQCELRFWTIAGLARAAGVTWTAVSIAHDGGDVSKPTARKIEAALAASPPSRTALDLLGAGLLPGREEEFAATEGAGR